MWFEKIKDINEGKLKGPLKHINLQFELHNAVYLVEVLDSVFDFSIEDTELCIKRNEKIILLDDFIYWWQIARYNEVLDEETKLITTFDEIRKKMMKLDKSIPKIEGDETEEEKTKKLKKREDITAKLSKLNMYLNKEGPLVKHKLSLLSNFRNMYPNRGSLIEILELVVFNLKQSDTTITK